MSDGIGYILPDGDAYTDEFECCFIYVPAKDEYRRALFGALDYFGTWLAWERDSAKRGKDAARAWKEANELTRECWDMGTCDLMVDLLQQLVDKESANACCVGNEYITYNDNRVETTTIVVDQGDPPEYYGETAVTDWDDWKEYVCFHAHAFVDDLVNSANKIDSLLDLGVWALDAAYWMMRQLVYRNPVWIVPIDLSWMTTIYKAILQGGEGYFDILADDIEDARDDIVCALINGTSLEDAVYSAIGGTLAWNLWYQFLDYDTTTAVIYNGGIDGFGYLTPIQRDDCECEEPLEPGQLIPNPSFDAGTSEWINSCLTYYATGPLSEPGCVGKTGDWGYCLRSADFTCPAGVETLWPQMRVERKDGNHTYYIRLHDAGTGQQVGNTFTYQADNNGASQWINRLMGAEGWTAAEPGEDYYVTVSCYGGTGQVWYLSFVKVWTSNPEA